MSGTLARGDCNITHNSLVWRDIITILRQNQYQGSIDVEGFHDPVYRNELEWTGQVSGLKYLQSCRGGDFITNPV